MKHLVRRQVIEVRLDAGQDAFSIQQQIRDYYYHQVMPILEKVCDELSTEGEIIDIDRLEIDLGDLGWKNNRFILDTDSIHRIVKRSFMNAFSFRDRRHPDTVVLLRTPEENACRQWLYYMEHGILPWAIQSTDLKWLERVLHQLAIDYHVIQQTKKGISGNYWFLSRLVHEHSEIFLQQLIEVMTAQKHPDLISRVTELLKPSEAEVHELPRRKKQIWKQVLKHYATHTTEKDPFEFLLTETKIIPSSDVPPAKVLTPEGIFCPHAGLVLLHPFFKHLFNYLLLLEEGIFTDVRCRDKAVILLYFIATGNTEPKDYELVVPKTLCGMPLQEVTGEESLVLTENERTEALNMIHAAIEQWDTIQNTSVDGLREGFLLREGKLLISDQGSAFRIESHAIDILLDRLPWNLQLIRFPWLEKLIRVEWR